MTIMATTTSYNYVVLVQHNNIMMRIPDFDIASGADPIGF